MKKIKNFAEIFGKSMLFAVIAVTALTTLSFSADLILRQGITQKSVSLLICAISLLIMITFPRLPTSYHNLVCKPANKLDNLSSAER